MTLPPELLALFDAWLWHAALVFLRVSAMVSVLPAFGERIVPGRIKIVIALMMTAVVAPGVPLLVAPDTPAGFARVAASEAVIGLIFGLGLRLLVLALQTAGSIAAQATSLAQILGAASVEPIPAMGYILVVAGLALAMMTGLHVEAARLLIGSYDLFPAGRVPDGMDVAAWGVAHVSRAFQLAFQLAAPFVIASIIYYVALGVINRAMPQLMVAFVGAPLITWGGLVLLLLAAPAMLEVWRAALGTYLIDPMAPPG